MAIHPPESNSRSSLESRSQLERLNRLVARLWEGNSFCARKGSSESAESIRIETVWEAECFDRYGMTEASCIATECTAHSGGMHILEEDLVVEAIDPGGSNQVDNGQMGELVITNTSRADRAIVRYRTGDMARLTRDFDCPCGKTGAFLTGGVKRIPPSCSQRGDFHASSAGITKTTR